MFASRSKLALEVLAAAHEPKPSPRLLLLVEFIDDVVLDGNDLVPQRFNVEVVARWLLLNILQSLRVCSKFACRTSAAAFSAKRSSEKNF